MEPENKEEYLGRAYPDDINDLPQQANKAQDHTIRYGVFKSEHQYNGTSEE